MTADREPLTLFSELPDYQRIVEDAARDWIARGKPEFPLSAHLNKPMFTTHVLLRGISMILAGDCDDRP